MYYSMTDWKDRALAVIYIFLWRKNYEESATLIEAINKKYDICQWSVQKNGLAIYYMYLNIPYGTENTLKSHGSLLIQIASL